MTSHIRHRRSYDPTYMWAALEPGELAVNTANRQIVLGGQTTGTPIPMLAIRMFATTSQYAAGDLVVYQGVAYRANTTIPPGPWNAAQWQLISADTSVLVQKTGDTMTGPLILDGPTPSSPNEAAAKAYVDAGDGAVTTAFQTADTHKVNKAGDTMAGILTLSADPANNLDAATKQYVDTHAVIGPPSIPDAPDAAHTYGRIGGATPSWSPALPLAGGAVTGPITLPADPTTALAASTKQYVDNSIAAIPPPVVPASIPTGTPLPWLTDTAPAGFLFANGQAVSRTTYAALFAVFGTTFGAGDGTNTFALPDLREVTLIGKATMGGTTDRGLIPQYTTTALGALVGEARHQITQAEMASHTHIATCTVTDPGHTHTYNAVSINASAGGSGYTPFVQTANVNTGSSKTNITVAATNASAGSDNAHNNVQPSFIVNWIIKT
jgi:microcystin-dependent protein